MRTAVITFPGSNCDRDSLTVLRAVSGEEDLRELGGSNNPAIVSLWHGDATLPDDLELIVVPGGFSYGDYLRSGAMAAHSPIMREVVKFAQRGGKVLGICNGFQVLTECGLLPGTLMRNAKLHFLCRDVFLRVENTDTAFTGTYKRGQVISVPIAHHDGNYQIDADGLKALEDGEQIAFRYCEENGDVSDTANPNGSAAHIAGVFNAQKNVLGMMPHPERHSEALLGGSDGRALFESLLLA